MIKKGLKGNIIRTGLSEYGAVIRLLDSFSVLE
jgi:hypothetical protein